MLPLSGFGALACGEDAGVAALSLARVEATSAIGASGLVGAAGLAAGLRADVPEDFFAAGCFAAVLEGALVLAAALVEALAVDFAAGFCVVGLAAAALAGDFAAGFLADVREDVGFAVLRLLGLVAFASALPFAAVAVFASVAFASVPAAFAALRRFVGFSAVSDCFALPSKGFSDVAFVPRRRDALPLEPSALLAISETPP
ncbi:hypothetical protein [Paracoccus tegillarcae]|uniref:hypothetical protein n=1 Tax=Paracoccus tegillarcae TaxID=1529068 RepID=UPI001E42E1B5|nr:hypothetical protein [Paracoccus tegillarcae]